MPRQSLYASRLDSGVRRHDSRASALVRLFCQRCHRIACNALPSRRSCNARSRQTSPNGSASAVCLARHDSIRSAKLAEILSVLFAAGTPHFSAPALVFLQRGLLRHRIRRSSTRRPIVASPMAQRQLRQYLAKTHQHQPASGHFSA